MGKWGNEFTEYGIIAARAALAEAGLDWRQIQSPEPTRSATATPALSPGRRSPRSWGGPGFRNFRHALVTRANRDVPQVGDHCVCVAPRQVVGMPGPVDDDHESEAAVASCL